MKFKALQNILIGLGLALLTISLHRALSAQKGLELTSMLLILIGSVYFGFALLSSHKKAAIIEIFVATAFVLIAIFGLWVSPWFLIIGLLLHGFWDLAHHNNMFKLIEIPKWYIPFCAAYDWSMAFYLMVWHF